MTSPRLVAASTAVAAALAVSGSGAASRAVAVSVPIPTASAGALAAANTLIAEPWRALLPTVTADAQTPLLKLDKDFMRGSGKVGSSSWSFAMGFANLRPDLAIESPPGFTAAGPGGFSVRAPLNGTWGLGVSGDLTARADATLAGKKLAHGSSTSSFSLSIPSIWLKATTSLDSTDPARPTLRGASVEAHIGIGGTLLAPQHTLDVELTRATDGSLSATVGLTQGSFRVAGFGVDERTNLTITFLPISSDFQTSLTVPDLAHVSAQGSWLYALLSIDGSVVAHFPSPVHNVGLSIPPSLLGIFPVPLPSAFAEAIGFAGNGAVPAVWPRGSEANPQHAPLANLDFSALSDTLEKGIAATHMPYGTVLSLDEVTGPIKTTNTSYGLDADSPIWTGHYLAAEAFRYAATQDPAALAQVDRLLDGIRGDFAATSDAYVPAGGATDAYAVVPSDMAGAVFARSTMPGDDRHNWTEPAKRRLGKRCLYVTSRGGWTVGGSTFPSLRTAIRHHTIAGAKPEPVEPVYGSGCGDADSDNPISRDQYSGLFMGLAYAYALVPAAKGTVRGLVDKALGYLLEPQHPWDVPLPPNGLARTTFLGGFDAQLSLLRIGATVDPSEFGAAYDAVKAASTLAWIPAWMSTIDPVVSYFKFNLDHAFLGPAVWLETDPAVRQNLLAAYQVVRAPTARDHNAWFGLVDILDGAASAASPSASNPSLSLADEVKSDLNDWMTRWTLVKNPNGDGMPTNATSTAAARHLAALWPGSVGRYSNGMGVTRLLATYPLSLYDRPGDGMDFVWQQGPYNLGIDYPSTGRKLGGYDCGAQPPTAEQITTCSSSQPLREGPGVDFLLPYWLAVYLKILPA